MEKQIKTINVSMSRKINLGNYEVKDYFVGLTIEKTEDQKCTGHYKLCKRVM